MHLQSLPAALSGGAQFIGKFPRPDWFLKTFCFPLFLRAKTETGLAFRNILFCAIF
jgi:hypothetical protein